MRILFLTFRPGFGHIRAAEAIDQALKQRYRNVETRHLNMWDIVDPYVSTAVQDGYLQMTADYPDLYQRLYNLDKDIYDQLAGKVPAEDDLIEFLLTQQRRWFPELAEWPWFCAPYKSLDSALLNSIVGGICSRRKGSTTRLLRGGMLRLIFRILSSRMRECVENYAPDLLVSTQMYPAALLGPAIQEGLIRQPLVGIITDYGVHGVWVRPGTGTYCVGHEITAQALRDKGVTRAAIEVTGIPLMQQFADPPSPETAREALGLDGRPTVLITGGQLGIGSSSAINHLLADRSFDGCILVTARPFTDDYAALNTLSQRHPERLKLLEWSDDMATLLRAADVVAGKPGGLSVSEALACGRPFIATCSLGGQEGHNVEFLKRFHIGFNTTADRLPAVLKDLFADRDALKAMQFRAERQGQGHSAAAVADRLERLLDTQTRGIGTEMSV